mgnify:CR=1 FL=1
MLRFTRRERRDWIRKMDTDVRLLWERVQEGKSIQTKYTPASVAFGMFDKVSSWDDKDVLVIANLEIYTFLRTLEREGVVSPKSITVLTDVDSLEGKPNIIVTDLNEINTLDLDMKYDIVIGNPPYNDEDSIQENMNHRRGSNLARVFLDAACTWVKPEGSIHLVLPVSRTLTPSVIRDLKKDQGLYLVQDVTSHFTAKLKAIAAVHCNKAMEGFDNEFEHFEKQEHSLADIYVTPNPVDSKRGFAKSGLRALLQEKGNTEVKLSMSETLYTNDQDLLNRISDKTFGSWRVGMNMLGDNNNIGRVGVVSPDVVLYGYVKAFMCNSQEEAEELCKYLESPEVVEALAKIKTTPANSKKFFEYISNPLAK